MNFPETAPSLSESDFENCAWEDVVEAAEKKECSAYRHLFFAKAGESQEADDEQARVVFVLMYRCYFATS